MATIIIHSICIVPNGKWPFSSKNQRKILLLCNTSNIVNKSLWCWPLIELYWCEAAKKSIVLSFHLYLCACFGNVYNQIYRIKRDKRINIFFLYRNAQTQRIIFCIVLHCFWCFVRQIINRTMTISYRTGKKCDKKINVCMILTSCDVSSTWAISILLAAKTTTTHETKLFFTHFL